MAGDVQPGPLMAYSVNKWTLWASARMVISKQGCNALEHARTRISELTAEGDEAGVKVWRLIAERIDLLVDPISEEPLSRQ